MICQFQIYIKKKLRKNSSFNWLTPFYVLIRPDVIWKKISRPLYHVHFTVIHTNSRHNMPLNDNLKVPRDSEIFYLATPAFHGNPRNIAWKSRVTCHKMTISKFHGIPWNIPWNYMALSFISFVGTRVPWNSMEYSMKFHGTLVSFVMAPS